MKKIIVLAFLINLLGCKKENESSLYSSKYESYDNENHTDISENIFINVAEEPTTTFSVDADGGSYSFTKDQIETNGSLPPIENIRVEEFINYFDYDYPAPNESTIHIETEMSECPWDSTNHILRIGIKGKELNIQETNSNFVFLIDVSGSMTQEMPMIKEVLNTFTNQMNGEDYISIVTYASNPGIALQPTNGNNKSQVKNAINGLSSGGSTNGEGGINQAYDLASKSFIKNGNNRVLLITDGDFNVGISNQEQLINLIESKREEGVYLTSIGVGRGNYNEIQMEQIANHGNGTYEYMANYDDGKRILVDNVHRLYNVAKDVKVQITFDGTQVLKYRLIGYENRVLNNEDFENDTKDAGEIGSGQTVTALYQLQLQENASTDIGEISFRYKESSEDKSKEIKNNIQYNIQNFEASSYNHRFVCSVAAYGLVLIESQYKGNASLENILSWKSNDILTSDEKIGFFDLVQKTKSLH